MTEKHTLLCEAVQVIELEEDDHKKSILNKAEQINDLRSQLRDLRQRYELLRAENEPLGDRIYESSDPQAYNEFVEGIDKEVMNV